MFRMPNRIGRLLKVQHRIARKSACQLACHNQSKMMPSYATALNSLGMSQMLQCFQVLRPSVIPGLVAATHCCRNYKNPDDHNGQPDVANDETGDC